MNAERGRFRSGRAGWLGSLAVAAALLTGCSSTSDPTGPVTVNPGESTRGTTASLASMPSSPSPSPSQSTPASPSSAGASTTTTTMGRRIDAARQSLYWFASPTANIICLLVRADSAEPASVRCSIADRNWAPPPKPSSCDLDWGGDLALSDRGRTTFVCAGDTIRGGGDVHPLAYGDTVTMGAALTCTSAATGVTCTNADRHGFSLSRAAYRRF